MKSKTSLKQLREFGLLLGILFPFIIGFLIPNLFGHDFRTWTIYFGIPILILGIFKPRTLDKIYKYWIYLGDILGWINSKIILSIVYLLILIPISLIMKLFGYDPLFLKRNLKDKSYRIEKDSNRDIVFKRIF